MDPAICAAKVTLGGSLVYWPSFRSADPTPVTLATGFASPGGGGMLTLQHGQSLESGAVAVQIHAHDCAARIHSLVTWQGTQAELKGAHRLPWMNERR